MSSTGWTRESSASAATFHRTAAALRARREKLEADERRMWDFALAYLRDRLDYEMLELTPVDVAQLIRSVLQDLRQPRTQVLSPEHAEAAGRDGEAVLAALGTILKSAEEGWDPQNLRRIVLDDEWREYVFAVVRRYRPELGSLITQLESGTPEVRLGMKIAARWVEALWTQRPGARN